MIFFFFFGGGGGEDIVGGHYKNGLFLEIVSIHFLRVNVQNGNNFGVAKISNNFTI